MVWWGNLMERDYWEDQGIFMGDNIKIVVQGMGWGRVGD